MRCSNFSADGQCVQELNHEGLCLYYVPTNVNLQSQEPINDEDILEMMGLHGSAFVRALAEAGRLADSDNLSALKEAFKDLWSEYRRAALVHRELSTYEVP